MDIIGKIATGTFSIRKYDGYYKWAVTFKNGNTVLSEESYADRKSALGTKQTFGTAKWYMDKAQKRVDQEITRWAFYDVLTKDGEKVHIFEKATTLVM
jgi:hypothetical protein